MDDPTVLYIMGYGRSGSTLLDAILSSHEEVVSIGAGVNLPAWNRNQRKCACGYRMGDCGFWQSVVGRYLQYTDSTDLTELTRCQDRIERVPVYAERDDEAERYGRHLRALFKAVAEVSGKSIIVDSSKSARDAIGRPYALVRHARLNVRPIFLARDGRGVMWSAMRGPGSPERASSRLPRSLVGLKTLASWLYTNHRCLRVLEAMPETALPVSYENLMSWTKKELLRIGSHVGVDMSHVARRVTEGSGIEAGHNLGGNRLRFSEKITISPDYEWRSELPILHRIVYGTLGRWLAAQLPHELSAEVSDVVSERDI